MSATIAQQVSQLVQTMAAQPAKEVTGAFSREQAELAGSGVPEGVIEVGATLPDAKLIDPTTGLPMPTTVILRPEHVVRWVDVHPDCTSRSEPVQILAALDAVAAR